MFFRIRSLVRDCTGGYHILPDHEPSHILVQHKTHDRCIQTFDRFDQNSAVFNLQAWVVGVRVNERPQGAQFPARLCRCDSLLASEKSNLLHLLESMEFFRCTAPTGFTVHCRRNDGYSPRWILDTLGIPTAGTKPGSPGHR